jgi:hypothetical protein
MGGVNKNTNSSRTSNKKTKMTRPAKRIKAPAAKRITRADKIRRAYDLKARVYEALNMAGLDTTLKYLPYAKNFDLLFVALEPDANERRVRLRRIISGVPKVDDAFWIEVLHRYCSEIYNVSRFFCAFTYNPGMLDLPSTITQK